MTLPDVPHFAFPMQYAADGHMIVVEQDSPDEIAACVKAAVVTPVGWRSSTPDFGSDDTAFTTPAGRQFLQDDIVRSEPRAQALLEEQPDVFDELIADISSWS